MANNKTNNQESFDPEVNEENKDKTVKRPVSQGTALAAAEKPDDFMGSISRIFKEILKQKWLMLVVFISSIVSVVLSTMGPRILGQATTELFNGVVAQLQGRGSIDFTRIRDILLFVLFIYLLSAVFSALQGFIMTNVTENVTYSLRKRLLEKIDRMPMKYFESRPYGEVLSRITNDIDTLGGGLSQSITQILTSILTMIGIAYMMFSINVTMALTVMVVLPVSIFMIRFLMRRSQKFFQTQQRSLGIINGQIEEVFAGQNIVKAFNQEGTALESFMKENDELKESAWKSQFFSGIMFPLMRLIGNLGYVAVVISGAYMAIMGRISVGDIQAFTQYVGRFTQPITQMAQIVTLMQSMAAAGERVYEFLDEAEEDQHSGQTLDVDKVEGNVAFDQVKFGYNPNQAVIHQFSAEIKPGQKVALVGPTGAGKSTVVKLLMRFYDVNNGKIMIDHVDSNHYSRVSYQQAMAMVLQDTWLFNGSLMENIRYGRLDATDEEVIEAAKAARVHHYITSLAGGYDFELNEEASNISQGQKQLLTIARAILANRPILILDEATSSVDTRTEILIQEAMDRLMEGRTSFIIAHRLSTIRNADLILYMEHGDIVEQGNHQSLMDMNGRYADLYNSQFVTQ